MVLRRNKSLISDLPSGVAWWFVFCNAKIPLISRITKKGFQHVFAFTQLGNVLLCVEPLLGAVNITVTDEKAKELIRACINDEGYTVVFFKYPPDPQRLKMRSPFITCASFLAYTVGFPFFGFTAYQLYKALLKSGGEVVKLDK